MGMSKHDNLMTNLLTHVIRVLPSLIYYTGIVTYSKRDVKGQAEELTFGALLKDYGLAIFGLTSSM